MSVERIAQVLNATTGVSAGAKLVLIGIANHDGDGGAWPSVATLARYAEMTTRSVQRHISDLEAAGLIERVIQGGGTANRPDHSRPNLYRVTLTSPGDSHVTGGMTATSPPPPDTSVTPRVTATSPEPSFNHPSEPSTEHTPFDHFWEAYPRRQGKVAARQRWVKMTEPERVAAMEALWGWCRYYETVAEQFVPHASTWLNQRRWEDDIPQPARPEVDRKTASSRAAIARLRTVPDSDVLDIFTLDNMSSRGLGSGT